MRQRRKQSNVSTLTTTTTIVSSTAVQFDDYSKHGSDYSKLHVKLSIACRKYHFKASRITHIERLLAELKTEADHHRKKSKKYVVDKLALAGIQASSSNPANLLLYVVNPKSLNYYSCHIRVRSYGSSLRGFLTHLTRLHVSSSKSSSRTYFAFFLYY